MCLIDIEKAQAKRREHYRHTFKEAYRQWARQSKTVVEQAALTGVASEGASAESGDAGAVMPMQLANEKLWSLMHADVSG